MLLLAHSYGTFISIRVQVHTGCVYLYLIKMYLFFVLHMRGLISILVRSGLCDFVRAADGEIRPPVVAKVCAFGPLLLPSSW